MLKRSLGLAVALGVLGLVVAGCGPIYDTKYSYTPPSTPEGKTCAMQCLNTQTVSQQNCKLARQNCESTARLRAERDFNRYVAEQNRNQQPVKKSVSDFYNGYGCSSDESSCLAQSDTSYRSCYQICGGKVTAQRVCTAFCDQEVPAGGVAAGGQYPKGLGQAGQEGFQKFQAAKTHKAFAVGADGAWGWRSGRASVDEAKAEAKAACEAHAAGSCTVVAVDDERLD